MSKINIVDRICFIKQTHPNGVDLVQVFPVLERAYYDSNLDAIVIYPDFFRMRNPHRLEDTLVFKVDTNCVDYKGRDEEGVPLGVFQLTIDGSTMRFSIK